MPKRDIASDLGTSESLSRVSIEAAFTFLVLTSVADDFGRFDGRLRILLARLYPLREEVTEAALSRWIDELEREGIVHRYESGQPLLHIPAWFGHRRAHSFPIFPEPTCCARSGAERIALATVSARREIGRSRATVIDDLIARDGDGCRRCGAGAPYHVDHVRPLAMGGSNNTVNLQLLCPPCNLGKGARVD